MSATAADCRGVVTSDVGLVGDSDTSLPPKSEAMLDRQLASVATDVATDVTPPASTVARVGLGAMFLFAGVHKLVDPAAWTTYVVDWLAPLLVVSPTTFMLANGAIEVGFAAAFLVDRWTAPLAAVAAVSLAATAGYLAVVGLTAGLFWDVFARDVGLAALALTVLAHEVDHMDSEVDD